VIVDTALYVAGKRVDGPVDISEQVDIARAKDGFVWVGLAEPIWTIRKFKLCGRSFDPNCLLSSHSPPGKNC
jgi:hypothetical protein